MRDCTLVSFPIFLNELGQCVQNRCFYTALLRDRSYRKIHRGFWGVDLGWHGSKSVVVCVKTRWPVPGDSRIWKTQVPIDFKQLWYVLRNAAAVVANDTKFLHLRKFLLLLPFATSGCFLRLKRNLLSICSQFVSLQIRCTNSFRHTELSPLNSSQIIPNVQSLPWDKKKISFCRLKENWILRWNRVLF